MKVLGDFAFQAADNLQEKKLNLEQLLQVEALLRGKTSDAKSETKAIQEVFNLFRDMLLERENNRKPTSQDQCSKSTSLSQ